jgi:hypothetical protein
MRAADLHIAGDIRQPLELVVRLMPAVYNRFPIAVEVGPPEAEINIRSARVRFPQPFRGDGSISDDCLTWIIDAVANASAMLRFGMCLVLSDDEAIYVEPDGTVTASTKPPRGGVRLNLLTKEPDEPLPSSVTISPRC